MLSAESVWEVVSLVKDATLKKSLIKELLFVNWAVVERVGVDEKQMCNEEQESIE